MIDSLWIIVYWKDVIAIMSKQIDEHELLKHKDQYLKLLDPKKTYTVGRFQIAISSDVIERYEENVFKVDAELLKGFTRFYNDNRFVNNEVMSAIITAQLLRELYQYV